MTFNFSPKFKERLEFTLCGLVGITAPAIAVVAFPVPRVAIVCTLITALVGMYVGVRMVVCPECPKAKRKSKDAK